MKRTDYNPRLLKGVINLVLCCYIPILCMKIWIGALQYAQEKIHERDDSADE